MNVLFYVILDTFIDYSLLYYMQNVIFCQILKILVFTTGVIVLHFGWYVVYFLKVVTTYES